jgi:hypothetical protein
MRNFPRCVYNVQVLETNRTIQFKLNNRNVAAVHLCVCVDRANSRQRVSAVTVAYHVAVLLVNILSMRCG